MLETAEHKDKSLCAYIEKRTDAFSKKIKCPNHSEGVEFSSFKEASSILNDVFSKAVDKYHADKWK